MKQTNVDIIGVPMDYGGNRRGVDMGPSAFRYSGLDAKLKTLGLIVHDKGNLHVPIPEAQQEGSKSLNLLQTIVSVNATLYDTVLTSYANGHFPVILGGDHSIAAGSALATQSHFGDVGIIWVDAHGDFNTRKTSVIGNMHGMPLASITGVETGSLAAFLPKGAAYINPKNTVVIGARDLDIAEADLLRASGVTVFTMQHIDQFGMRETIRQAIEIASEKTRGFHVSFDLDVIAPKEAPGVGTPVKGGITYREAHLLMEMLYASDNMLGLDMVELNPITDHGNITGELAVSLILSALGKNIF